MAQKQKGAWFVCPVCKGSEPKDEDGNYNHICPGPPKPKKKTIE